MQVGVNDDSRVWNFISLLPGENAVESTKEYAQESKKQATKKVKEAAEETSEQAQKIKRKSTEF